MAESKNTSDVVIIGSGATGLTAALTLVEGNARVILIEKMQSLGGISNFAEGMFAVESDMQRMRYINYTRNEAFKAIMEYSHWRANPRLVRAFVNETAATISWLQQHTVEFEDVLTNMPNGVMVWHILKGPERERGSYMIKTLASMAKEKGAEIWLGIPVIRIIKENEKITGIIAEKEGEEIQISTKTVLIATGGYANNKNWIKKYTGFDLGVNLMLFGNVGKMGDGIRMAWEVGADEEGMGVLQLLRGGPMLGQDSSFFTGPIESAACQPGLWINQDGERYCDESIQGNFALDGNAMARQRGRYVYAVFDESNVNHWDKHGTDLGMGRVLPPGSHLKIKETLKEALKKGLSEVYAANTIEDLAKKISIDPAILKATVEEYNGFCAKGHDDHFAKDPRYLRPLKEPMFYALKCNISFLGTLGGIKVNHKMEVTDKKGNSIPGLYAGGLDAGGIYGDSYDVMTCGGTFAFAVNSGRIAGRNILTYIKQ